MFFRKRPVSWLQEAGAALRVDLLHWGLTCFIIWSSSLQHFCVTCSALLFVDWAPPTLQVAEKAQELGSGLLAKGCQPNTEQFIGIFAQNRTEVWIPPVSFRKITWKMWMGLYRGSVQPLESRIFSLNFVWFKYDLFLSLCALEVCWPSFILRAGCCCWVWVSRAANVGACLLPNSFFFNITGCQAKPVIPV